MKDPIRSRVAPLVAVLDGWRVTARRSRIPGVVVVTLVGLIGGLSIERALDDAARRRAAWGAGDPAWVVRRPLPAGATIDRSDVEQVEVPSGLRPVDATVEPPWGRRLRQQVGAAEVLREGRLVDGEGASGTVVGPGRVGLPIEGPTPFSAGDLVAVHDRLVGGRLTSEPAEVIAADDHGLVIAASSDDVARVIRALSAGGVVVVLVG